MYEQEMTAIKITTLYADKLDTRNAGLMLNHRHYSVYLPR